MIVGLDIGTKNIRVAIGDFDENGNIYIAGTASRKSAGVSKGCIVNIEETKNAIRDAVEMAEQNAGVEVSSVVTCVGGSEISSTNSKGVVSVSQEGRKSREITDKDIARVIDSAQAVAIPMDRLRLHSIPRQYIVDGVGNIKNPINRIGVRLECELHLITAARTIVENIQATIGRAGYESNGVMFKSLATTHSVMQQDEMELGSILIDLGHGSTDVMVILGGTPVCSMSIPVGGDFVTNDIALVKGISRETAEDIKETYGCCWMQGITMDSEVLIPGVGGQAPEQTYKSEICQIVQPRMEEIFTLVRKEIMKNSSIKQLSGNIILTGGGAEMEGVVELAQAVFGTTAVRIGYPENLGGVEEDYRKPSFATAIGLVLANKNENASRDSHKKRKIKNAKKAETNRESFWSKVKKSFF